MLSVAEIKEKIKEATEKISEFTKEKEDSEKKRSNGESLLDRCNSLEKEISEEIEKFETNLKKRTEDIPGNFSEYYQNEVLGAMKESGIYNAYDNITDIKSLLRNRILGLDDIIEDYIRKIAQENTWLQELKSMLDTAVDVIQDIIPGGE